MRPDHFRFKVAESGQNKEWQCCICLHVRTATIMFGLWHMLLHILAMSIMVALLNNPSLIISHQNGLVVPPRSMPTQIQFGSDQNLDHGHHGLLEDVETEQREMSRRLAEMGPTKRPDYEILRTQMTRYTDIQSGILITFCTMLMTMALVMGALRGKPSLLMPFFCFQLFDFCIGLLAGVSYLTVLPDVHRIVAENSSVPFQSMLLEFNQNCLALILVLSFMVALLIKAYFIRVVWKCYKFLILRSTSHASIHVIGSSSHSGHAYDSQNLLPGYDKYAMPPPPPPSYDLATASAYTAAPPSYQVAIASSGAHVALPVERDTVVSMETAPSVAMETTGRNDRVAGATSGDQAHSG